MNKIFATHIISIISIMFVCLFIEIMCVAPNIENAEIVGGQRPHYRINSRIQYKCHPGFEPEQPVQITCNFQAQWTGIRQCTGMYVSFIHAFIH